MARETYKPAPHRVTVWFTDRRKAEYDACLSGIVNEPDRLWVELIDGDRIYINFSIITSYKIGAPTEEELNA